MLNNESERCSECNQHTHNADCEKRNLRHDTVDSEDTDLADEIDDMDLFFQQQRPDYDIHQVGRQ
jgi:hypothetical protein